MGKSTAAAVAFVVVGFTAATAFVSCLNRPASQSFPLSLHGAHRPSGAVRPSVVGLWVPLAAISVGLAAAANWRVKGQRSPKRPVPAAAAAAVADTPTSTSQEEGLAAYLVNGHRAKRETRQSTEGAEIITPPQAASEVSLRIDQQIQAGVRQQAVAQPPPAVQRKAPARLSTPTPTPTALAFDPTKQLGVTAPLGFFDPASFCKAGDQESFRQLRTAEVKHGRVAMMAAAGAVAQSVAQLPGFDGVPKGLGAVLSVPGSMGFAALVLAAGCLELIFWKENPETSVEAIGDFGNPLAVPVSNLSDMRNRELNNGRAAMFAIVGIMSAELATGKTALEQLM